MPVSRPASTRSRAKLGLGAERRLRRHAEFVRAQKTGRRVTTPHFALLVCVSSALDPPKSSRLGIVTSRKVGGAVIRNRIRRLCRECFRRWPDLLPPGVDLIAIARAGAADLGLAEVEAEWRGVERLLRKRASEALAQGASKPHLGGR